MGGLVVAGKIAAHVVEACLEPGPVKLSGTLDVRISRAGRTVAEARFGLTLAARYLCLGPFDNSDGKGLERVFLDERRLSEGGRASALQHLAAGRASRPRASRRGATARLPSTQTGEPRELVARGDVVDVDRAFGAEGPRVVYLVRDIVSDEERRVSLRVGSSDGVKLWVNGRRLLSDHTHRYATPDDLAGDAVLRKGRNRIAIKLARCGGSSAFRLRITERGSEEAAAGIRDAT
jgi:hypothetical protein